MTRAGIANGVLFGLNVDFTQNVNPSAQITTDGQLLIGSTASPNIRAGSLTSTGGTISITPGAGTINLEATSLAGPSLSPYIVGATKSDYTTISAAIAQAVSDGASATNQYNIYVKPGIYTENLTLSDGINVFGMDEQVQKSTFPSNNFPSVKLIGIVTHSAGDCKINNIWIAPPSNSNLFVLSSVGGVLTAKQCRLSPTGTNSILHATNASAVVLDQCSTTSVAATTKFIETTTTDLLQVYLYNTSILSTVTSTVFTGGFLNLTIEDSDLNASIDASVANTVSFESINSTHSNTTTTTDPLIDFGASTNGDIIYYNSILTETGTNLFVISNAAIVVYLINSSVTSGSSGDACTGGATFIKAGFVDLSNNLVFKNIATGYSNADAITGQAAVQTTDATPTVLASILVNQLDSITLKGTIVGSTAAHASAIGGDFLITATRATAGNVTLIGSAIANVNSNSAATFTADVDTGTQTVRVMVTGVALSTFNWVTTYTYQKVLLNT